MKSKKPLQSRTILTFIVLIVAAVSEGIAQAVQDDEVRLDQVNWTLILTSVLAIVLRFFSHSKIS